MHKQTRHLAALSKTAFPGGTLPIQAHILLYPFTLDLSNLSQKLRTFQMYKPLFTDNTNGGVKSH